MVFPCMFDEIHALRDLKEAAHLLAEKEDWPQLYDVSKLNNNKVRTSQKSYHNSCYMLYHTVKGSHVFIGTRYIVLLLKSST
jgi:hypothetical protein